MTGRPDLADPTWQKYRELLENPCPQTLEAYKVALMQRVMHGALAGADARRCYESASGRLRAERHWKQRSKG